MNAACETSVPYLTAVALLIALASAGCSDRQEKTDGSMISSPPLVTAPLPIEPAPEPPIRTDAGGMPTTYTPVYQDGQLVRIAEERVQGSTHAEAAYEFQGARLLRYEGASLADGQPLQLEFDLRGVLISPQQDAGTAPEHEVAAIRTRAQLLRSHALAQHATFRHQGQEAQQTH